MRERFGCGCTHTVESGEITGWVERCPRHEGDCDRLGFSEAHYAALTGFSGRAVRALAHLREAWCGADARNMIHVEAAIRALRQCHSLADPPGPGLVRLVLSAGLDDGQAERILRTTMPR